jgi:hypothetical protein
MPGMRSLLVVAVTAALTAAACSTTSSAGSTSGPQQACLDTADAVGKAALRCGGDYTANYNAFIKCTANGDCANITQVRDEPSLRDTCLPKFQTIQCPDLTSGNLDASCKGQLLHAQFATPSGC